MRSRTGRRCTRRPGRYGTSRRPPAPPRTAIGHAQRRPGQLGVVVDAHGEPEHAPRMQIQHRREYSLPSSVGISVRSPHHATSGAGGGVKSRRSSRAPCAPICPAWSYRADSACAEPPNPARPSASRRCSRSPASPVAQVRGDPRRPVGPVVLGEQVGDRRRPRRPPFPTRRPIPVAPLVKPRLRHPQRPARHRYGTPCSALWAAINAARLTAPSLP